MSRAGFLIVVALVLALIAAGVLVWTNQLSQDANHAPRDASSPPTLTPDASSGEAEYMALTNDAAAGTGFVATFAENSARWQVSDGHRLERIWLKEPDIVMARLASSLERRDDMLLQGLSVELPVEFAQQVNGKKIEVGILARMPQTNGAGEVSLVYATRQAGNSGWKQLKLSPQFALHSFVYEVPKVDEGYTVQPAVVIHADTSGKGRAVEILGIFVKQAQ